MVVWTWQGRSRSRRGRARVLALGLAALIGVEVAGCGRGEPSAAAVTQPGARRNEMADYMKTHPPAKAGTRSR